MQGLQIGQVAKLAGVGVETVRFYERQGLLGTASRRASGYRVFQPEMVRRLQFIRHAKDLGFTLKEVAELLELRTDPNGSCAEIRSLAVAKLAQIDERIAALQRMGAVLQNLTSVCPGATKPRSQCPILDALDSPEAHIAIS